MSGRLIRAYNCSNEIQRMSHSHIRVHETAPPPKPQYTFWASVSCIVVCVIAVFLWSNLRADEFWERHSSVEGTVTETRVVMDHIRDSQYGGHIYYRLEAHVRFRVEGKDQDRWLTVPQDSMDRATLTALATGHPKKCLVYWVPGHAENAKCKLD
jgi:hypothetical protein